jgi:hypothetical protein
MNRGPFPGGKRFAFTIFDDTDVATVANIGPIYRLLHDLGMRTTKTVWPLPCPEGSPDFSESETLADPGYRSLMNELHGRGVELTWHCATMESSTRERTELAMERFRAEFGHFPRLHANHAMNRENIYWGTARLDDSLLRRALRASTGVNGDYFAGHDPKSVYWWGDLCAQRIVYGRNLTFNEVDVTSINPSMPYRDPARPLVPWWFSASDAEDVDEFVELLRPAAIDRLERDGGVCIVATHLGKGYVRDGAVDPAARMCLEELARRDGWFVPVGELLDFLRSRRATAELPSQEWRRMQWRWARDLVVRKVRARLRRRSWRDGMSTASDSRM